MASGFQVQTWPLLSKASRRAALPATLTAKACMGRLMAFLVGFSLLVHVRIRPSWSAAMRRSAAMAMLM